MNAIAAERSAPRLTRIQQLFLYVAPFSALAFFKVWASTGREPDSLLIAGCAMLVYCAFCLTLALRWDKPTYLDWAVSAYFLTIVLFLALWPGRSATILTEYAVTGIYVCLFCAAFLPPLIGLDPFTYHYAKKFAPKAVWGTSIFANINRIMTFVWAGIFAICIILSLYPSVITRAVIPISLILGVGMPFNFRFPDLYLKRLGLPTLSGKRKFSLPNVDTAASHTEGPTVPHSAAAPPQPVPRESPAESPKHSQNRPTGRNFERSQP